MIISEADTPPVLNSPPSSASETWHAATTSFPTFSQFHLLPPELRHRIWKLALLPNSQFSSTIRTLHTITFQSSPTGPQHFKILPSPSLKHTTRLYRTLLQTSREARQTVHHILPHQIRFPSIGSHACFRYDATEDELLLALPDSETLHEFRRTMKIPMTAGAQATYLEALGLPGKLIVGNDGSEHGGVRLSIMNTSSGIAIVEGKLYLPAKLLSRGERAILSLSPSCSSSSSKSALGTSSLPSSFSGPPSALDQNDHDDKDASPLLGGTYLSIPAPSSPPKLLPLPLSVSFSACAPDCPVSLVCGFLLTSLRHRPWIFGLEKLIRDWEENLLGLGVGAGDLSGRQGAPSAADQEFGEELERRSEGRLDEFRCEICGSCGGKIGGRKRARWISYAPCAWG